MYGRSLYFDISKAKNDLGYTPKYNTKQMFIQSYDWFLDNFEEIQNKQGGSAHSNKVKERILKIIKWT